MLLSLDRGITYGPVRSRRLGRSLGVNVLPRGRKTCNFDCRYCQYGFTEPSLRDAPPAAGFPSVGEVREAVEAALRSLPEPPAYLTFSGTGEPTLHPRFPELVETVRDLRDRLAPEARTGILSNSSRVGDATVRRALTRLDVRIMKLDAGTEASLHGYSGAAPGLALPVIVDGLRELGGVTLQSLFANGPSGNLAPEETDAWVEAVLVVRPIAVQLYTLDRTSPCEALVRATREQLESLRWRLDRHGVPATVFG